MLLLQAKKTYHTKFKFLPYCVNGWGKGEEKRGTCLLWLHFRLRLVPTHQETARLQAASGAHRSLKLFDGMSFCQYKVEDEYCSFYQNNAIYFMARTFQKWIWCANYCFGLCKIIFSNILHCCPFFLLYEIWSFLKNEKIKLYVLYVLCTVYVVMHYIMCTHQHFRL